MTGQRLSSNMAGALCSSCRLAYVSVGCNRTPLSVDWGKNGLVAYGACHSVALYRPENKYAAGAVEFVLNGHKDRVNCVKWIPREGFDPEDELVSGSTDNTAIVWQWAQKKWQQYAILSGHTSAVNAVSAICISNEEEGERTLVVTASADSTVKTWERAKKGGDFHCTQTLSFGNGFILTVALTILQGSRVPVLSCGGEDCKVQIFTEKENKFVKVQSLAGHEDWIRGLDFTKDNSGDILLASCSQDCMIRIWRFSLSSHTSAQSDVADEFGELRLMSNIFTVMDLGKEREFSVVLESVLAGHEGWVYGVSWQPACDKGDGTFLQPMCLLSASMDKTLILWKPDQESGIWMEKVRVGEVGGNTLGFYGGVLSPDGRTILGHGYQGAFYLWNRVNDGNQDRDRWEPGLAVGGHFAPVQDIDWDPKDGQFLLSVSSDQTTRLHGPWRRPGYQTTWHELARPQIHGYNMQCLALLSRYRLASAGDEKVVRVFSAPRQFVETFQRLCQVTESDQESGNLPLGASVPALGLSNKAVFEGDLESLKKDLEDPSRPMKASAFASEEPAPFSPATLQAPPTEDILLQNMLWPEVQKLYGHGFEIYCVASSPDGKILASACKASKPEHSSIILWDTFSWTQLCTLSAHTLTVTQMAFSRSGQRLLSVSRDRSWALFRRKAENEEGPKFTLAARSDRKTGQHARIIWSCAWSSDDRHFVTASRDKKVIVWGSNSLEDREESWQAVSTPLDVGEPATAVDFAPLVRESRYVLAIGTESGRIVLYSWRLNGANQQNKDEWLLVQSLDQSICHVLTIRRLRWRRTTDLPQSDSLQLASCSLDHSVRIFDVIGLA